MNRRALGRGLEALIPGASAAPAPPVERAPAAEPRLVETERIRPNPYQPRTDFDSEALRELADSIRENGLIQPVVVRPVEDGAFELIAGERRLMAARQAGLREVPVVVRRATRREMLEIALVENLQREDLNPLEEAEAFQRLATEFGLTQEEIAKRVGKSRTAVTNALRLLTLPGDVRELIANGDLSAGHARAVLALPDETARRRLARDIVTHALSVRQAELKAQGTRRTGRPAGRRRLHPALEAWEERLRERFGTQVRLVGGTGRGRIEIHYFNEDDLERVLSLVGVTTGL